MSKRKYNIAVVGATGAVGKEFMKIIPERNFPYNKVHALASSSSEGKEVSFGEDRVLRIENLSDFDFTGIDFAFFTAGASISEKFAKNATEKGAVVIDNTSHFRMIENIPLVVPEINYNDLKNYKETGIIANPNCSTIQMVMALQPLSELATIKRVVVASYQSVSGAGKEAMDELYDQTKGIYASKKIEPKNFSKQIAFNVIPQIDVFMADGYTKEEWKMKVETKKIMHQNIAVSATCVRVPVFIGHSLALNVEFEEEVKLSEAVNALKKFKGVQVLDERKAGGYATPVEVKGQDDTFVSRIRLDDSVPYGLNLWVVADNVRKGAALNAVQIAEKMIEMGLK